MPMEAPESGPTALIQGAPDRDRLLLSHVQPRLPRRASPR